MHQTDGIDGDAVIGSADANGIAVDDNNTFQHLLMPAKGLIPIEFHSGDFYMYQQADSDSDGDSHASSMYSDADSALEPRVPHENSNLKRYGYRVKASPPLNLALLVVCHEIYTEATPIFTANVHFVLQVSSNKAMRFFKTLPIDLVRNITTLTLCSEITECWQFNLYLNNEGATRLPHNDDWPPMFTPFGSFLIHKLPKLADIYFEAHVGLNDAECDIGLQEELGRLLCHGQIARLHYVFCGEKAGEVLRESSDSREAFDRFTGGNGIGTFTALHEYSKHHHHEPEIFDGPVGSSYSSSGAIEYEREHRKLFAWKWGERDDVKMGDKKVVQAVITTWMK